ncbi:MAG: DUF5686 family protein [Bacteroidota bacterium]
MPRNLKLAIHGLYANLSICLCFTLSVVNLHAQEMTISGQLIDASTTQSIPFSNVWLLHSGNGVNADSEGQFTFTFEFSTKDTLVVGALGYHELKLPLLFDDSIWLDIALQPRSHALGAVTIKAGEKVKKDSAAIALFRKIVKAKPENRITGLDQIAYRDYTKTEYDIFNIKKGFINTKLLKSFDFVFDYVDSTDTDTPYLPVLMREKIKDVYWQKSPEKRKEILQADRFSGVKDYYKWQLADLLVGEVDIYANLIIIRNKGFLGPFAPGANMSYKYFLSDSLEVSDDRFYKLEFTPKRKGDLCFTGSVWVHGASYAITEADLTLLNKTNLNFINNFTATIKFEQTENGNWVMKDEVISLVANLTRNKKHQSIRIIQTTNKEILSLSPIDNQKFKGERLSMADHAFIRAETYWEEFRPKPLSSTESGIYQMMDTLQSSRPYKRLDWLAHAGYTGYLKTGPVEFGRYYQLFSWNVPEGNRFRLGIRNNKYTFRQKLRLDGYLAYGDKDKLLKYHAGFEFHLPRKHHRWHTLSAYYHFDWGYNPFYDPWYLHDDFFKVLTTPWAIEHLYLTREAKLKYEMEWFKGFMNRFSAGHKTIYAWPGFMDFQDHNGQSLVSGEDKFESLELGFETFWTVVQKKEKTRKKGTAISFSAPKLELKYVFAPGNLLGGDFEYHKLQLGLKQKIFSGLGSTKIEFKAGQVFGEVPFPFLELHNGNETKFSNPWSYGLMDYSEFASDRWTSVWIDHHFDGLLFNLIPGVRRLKLRTVLTGKLLVGDMRTENEAFLAKTDGLSALNGHYLEAGFGVENIARILRIDFLWRLTQREAVDVRKFGIQLQIKPGF